MKTLDQEGVLAYLQGKVVGPCTVDDLRHLQGFTLQTMVSFPGSEKWAPAFKVLKLMASSGIPMGTPASIPHPEAQIELPRRVALDRKAQSQAIKNLLLPQPQKPGLIVDRWLKRLLVLNLVLGGIAYGSWSYPSLRARAQSESRPALLEGRRQAAPLLARWRLLRAVPKARAAFQKVSVSFAKAKTNLLKTAMLQESAGRASVNRLSSKF